MNILLIGSSGFVGSNFLQYAISKTNYNFICLTRKIKKDNDRIRYLIFDKNFSNLNLNTNIDIVVYCLGNAHNVLSKKKANEILNEELEILDNFFQLQIIKSVRQFIYISSIKIYNSNEFKKIVNIDTPIKPNNFYGKLKFENESKITHNCKKLNINFNIIRPVLIYGPGMKGNLKFINFFKNYLPIVPLINKSNSRSVLNIYNLCDFIIHLIVIKYRKNDVFLLSDNKNVSTNEFIKKLINKPNKNYFYFNQKIIFLKKINNFINKFYSNLVIDISSTTNKTGWKPKYNLDNTNN